MNDLADPQFIKDLMRHYHVRAKDYMGQNFLVDERALEQIVSAAGLNKNDTVLEVGPGLGVLTQQLAKSAGKVVAVEKDKAMLPILEVNIKGHDNVQVVNADILKLNLQRTVAGPYKVVANIPYYLTSFLFQHFLSQDNKPQSMTLLVQKEVGERVTASAGELSVLGISVQLHANPEIVDIVPKTSFWPQPKVDSVILRIVPALKFPQIADEKKFFKMIKIAFSGKRKQLHNNFTSGLHEAPEKVKALLSGSGIDPSARAQDVALEKWVDLYQHLK